MSRKKIQKFWTKNSKLKNPDFLCGKNGTKNRKEILKKFPQKISTKNRKKYPKKYPKKSKKKNPDFFSAFFRWT